MKKNPIKGLSPFQSQQLQGLLLQKRCSIAEDILFIYVAEPESDDTDPKDLVKSAFLIEDIFMDEVEKIIEQYGVQQSYFGPLYDEYDVVTTTPENES